MSATAKPASTAATPPRRRRALRITGFVLGGVALVVAGGGGWFYSRLRASLPRLDGEVRAPGLSAPVEITRDALGVPTIQAANRLDASRALGYLHAQDRFFQMDLLRRKAAGELAELFGPPAVPLDRAVRIHGLRRVARQVVERARPLERALLDAYTAGVAAGLADLGAKPFEYTLGGFEPAAWMAEDSVLVVLAMFLELHDETAAEDARRGAIHDALPPALAAFLTPSGTAWDAPLEGEPLATPPTPGPEVFDLRTTKPAAAPLMLADLPGSDDVAVGSNNWAVGGAHTAHGGGMLANDMHLGIQIPNTWYRVAIVRADGPDGQPARMTGVSLAGVPSVAVGSNGHVAWGFTNSYGDWTDRVLIELDPADPRRYLTPEGSRPFTERRETVQVRGAAPVDVVVQETVWGPVLGKDSAGRLHALAWTAHFPEAVDFAFVELDDAQTVAEAMALAHRSGIPPQNFVVADAAGAVAWTLIGKVPRRVGCDGRLPTSRADGVCRWDGWLGADEIPAVVAPPTGRVWTANSRVVGGEALAKIGDGGYDLGARAKQIRDGLLALEGATPKDLLAIQLDDRALFLTRWRDRLLAILSPEVVAADPRRAELRRLVEATWTGRASPDSVAYRVVRAFRSEVSQIVFADLLGLFELPETQRFGPPRQFEGPLWQLLTEQPAHLLAPRHASWQALQVSAVDQVLDNLARQGPNLAERTWGERNTLVPRHPFAQAAPALARWLNLPPTPLPGDSHMPRVQVGTEGASERLVVAPGREAEGLFHMPIGQSGHPLSPYYAAGHEAWVKGEPTPFLPGPAVHHLRLVPGVGGGS